MSTAWAREAATTITDFTKERENNIMQKRALLALLKKRGKISFGHSGLDFTWPVKYARAPISGYADTDTISFPRRNRDKQARLDWRGYRNGESYSELEQLKNRSTQQIINIVADVAESMTDDAMDGFCLELYTDGYASGNTRKICGLESCLGKHATNTGGTNRTFDPSDTYAGLPTDLAQAGTWTGDWPDGVNGADASYDYNSPVLVNTTGTGWGTSASFAAYGNKQLRYGITKTRTRKASKGQCDLILFNDSDWLKFLDIMETKERLMTQRGANNSLLLSMGFGETMSFDGVDTIFEAGVPADTTYGLNTEMMEIRCMYDRMFKSRGPTWVEEDASYILSVGFWGNMKLSPRSMFKLYPYT